MKHLVKWVYESSVLFLFYLASFGFLQIVKIGSWFLWVKKGLTIHQPEKLKEAWTIDFFMNTEVSSGTFLYALVLAVFSYLVRLYALKKLNEKASPAQDSEKVVNETYRIGEANFMHISRMVEEYAKGRISDVERGAETPRLAALLLEKYAWGVAKTLQEVDNRRGVTDLADRLCREIDPDFEANRKARWEARPADLKF